MCVVFSTGAPPKGSSMAVAEVEELEHPLLLGGGTTGLINLEKLKLNIKSESYFITVGIVTKNRSK